MKIRKQMQKAFGINEFGQADLPVKILNVQISRIVYGTKADAHIAFLTDSKQVTQRSPTGSATESVSERHSGGTAMNSPIELKGKKPSFELH